MTAKITNRFVTTVIIFLTIVSIAQAKYGGGSGTADDPYQIATAADLLLLGDSPEDYDKHFILTADIDLDPNLPGRKVFDKAVIAPDVDALANGYQGAKFAGTLKAQGRRILNMTISGADFLGLFGYIDRRAVVLDLGLEDVNVNGTGSHIGGLAGFTWDSNIITTYSTGAVSGSSHVGGLVGENSWFGGVTQCYSTARVSGEEGVGGLVGESWGNLTHCYSVGAVSGSTDVGGLVGNGSAWSVTCSFWDVQTSGQTKSAGGAGKTTVEMQTPSTFFCWGYDSVWTIDNGRDYPRLRWENKLGNVIIRPDWVYQGGSGTKDDPYLIYTTEHLNIIGLLPCDWSKHFKLMADIDLSGFDGKDGRPSFNIIGTSYDNAFTGLFDGNGHTVLNFNYTSTDRDYMGLFGYVDDPNAEIKNLRLTDPNVDAGTGSSVGSLVGYMNNGTIADCCARGGTVVGGSRIGGLVGDMGDGSITRCYSACTVFGNESLGGLVGSNLECSEDYCGGGLIMECYSTGAITGGLSVGGLVGYNLGGITDSYATGNITGNSSIGGLVGTNWRRGRWGAVSGTISNGYSTGTVSGDGDVGGLVGEADVNAVVASFWGIETSGQEMSAGGTGKTTAEMQKAATFLEAGWDLVNLWGIGENQTYPYLRKYSAADINQDTSVNFLDLAALAENWLTGPAQ